MKLCTSTGLPLHLTITSAEFQHLLSTSAPLHLCTCSSSSTQSPAKITSDDHQLSTDTAPKYLSTSIAAPPHLHLHLCASKSTPHLTTSAESHPHHLCLCAWCTITSVESQHFCISAAPPLHLLFFTCKNTYKITSDVPQHRLSKQQEESTSAPPSLHLCTSISAPLHLLCTCTITSALC